MFSACVQMKMLRQQGQTNQFFLGDPIRRWWPHGRTSNLTRNFRKFAPRSMGKMSIGGTEPLLDRWMRIKLGIPPATEIVHIAFKWFCLIPWLHFQI